MSESFGHLPLIDLFRAEAREQLAVLTRHLVALEHQPPGPGDLEAMMRAAHSMKGAAHIVNLVPIVRLSHVMEDCLVAAQKGTVTLGRGAADTLLKGVDFIEQMSALTAADMAEWQASHQVEVDAFISKLDALTKQSAGSVADPVIAGSLPVQPALEKDSEAQSRVLRVTADNLNRLLGLAGESLVESRRLGAFNRSLLRLKRMQQDLVRSLEALREHMPEEAGDLPRSYWREAFQRAGESRQLLLERMEELDRFDRTATHLSSRLYREALSVRMRPFTDGVTAFPRMVRDVGRQLGKEARLIVLGENTQVDRDILEKIEAPITHLVRNALDHGLEAAADRVAAGKSMVGTIRLEARHRSGMLFVSVADDGKGIDLDAVREAVIRRGHTTAAVAATLSSQEIMDFLFLPGFSLRDSVTEISGRGVGLDIVSSMLKAVRGTVRVTTETGKGTTFELQLPVALSVVRALLVEIAGEPYALPLTAVSRVMRVERDKVDFAEGRPHIAFEQSRITLVYARQVLELAEAPLESDDWKVVVLGEKSGRFGFVVDRLLGERELVVQPLNSRLGKIEDVAACSGLEDGAPVLILDAEDLRRSMARLVDEGQLGRWSRAGSLVAKKTRKRVLVVDDSLTVRELERKLLANRGYEVSLAVDGMEGWNAARTGNFDLVITDVDMPRMDGIEFVRLMKQDERLKSRPVMIVSYKDREEDRRRGLEAGADYYLTKGSFHDESLIDAVKDLIGFADEEGAS